MRNIMLTVYEPMSVEEFTSLAETPEPTKIDYSCPYIDEIKEILGKYQEDMEPEDTLQVSRNLEQIRKINHRLREVAKPDGLVDDLKNSVDYNVSAILKTIKIKLPEHVDLINEVIKTYT